MNTVLGVDACKSGWVGIALSGDTVTAHHARRIAALVEQVDEVAVVAIDIPVGLPDSGRRKADLAARELLGPRRSSVFITPVRAAVAETDYDAANAANRRLAGEGMSRQAFGLFDKIREVDAWLPAALCRVVEVHPELSFRELAGTPLADPKRTWAGAECRRRLLADAGITLPGELGAAGRLAAVDDVLDAAAAAWTARRVLLGTAVPVPDPPEPLGGIEAAIWR
jgi:predicted RNase H-like nuclease